MGIKTIIGFFSDKGFWKQILFLLLFIGIVVFAALHWVENYTHHGQKLEMPDYIGVNFHEAAKDAQNKSFVLIVEDSVHIVGKSGGEIIDQNPKPHSMVKQDRKVYVTRTKYQADVISVGDLPVLYGLNYGIKSRELKFLNIESEIKSYKFDTGEKDHILEVWSDGKKIIDRNGIKKKIKVEKGGKLSFVLSKKHGGTVYIPNIRCKTFAEVKFMLEQLKLKIGKVNNLSDKTDEMMLYVVRQYPLVDQSVMMGDKVDITLSDELPDDCQ